MATVRVEHFPRYVLELSEVEALAVLAQLAFVEAGSALGVYSALLEAVEREDA